MDLQEYPGSMPACFEKGLPRCPVKAVIPTMTMETTDGIKKLQNTVVHVIQNNATYYVDDKHRITEICSDPVERNNYDFEENPENFRGQLVFDYDNQRGVYYNNRGEIFNLVVDGLSFDSLTNRPKYNGSEMTHATNIPLVPTQLSQLENDSGFITESVVTDDIAAHNVDPTAHADIRQAITDEATARATADNTLDGKITAEETARIAADNALATADSVLDDKITAEATARAAADNTLDSKITTETTDRATADATLQSNINAEATARANADTSLGNRITSEETTRSAADSALAGDISAEVTRAEAAETALGGRIDDEATTRAAADTTLDGKITAEATARANADSTLDGKITDEATARANADTALGTRITDETTARTNADTAINNKLNRTVLYDLEMQTDASNVTFVEDKVNLGTGATTTERDVIPAASPTTAGTISASEYVSLVDAEEKITALLEGAVAIDNLPANPTQQQLTNAWLAATGKTELINRASIYDSANQLVHTYYTNVAEWEDSPAGGQITIDQFTNSAAGIIKGSTTDGNVSANLDGTGTVSGWTALKNTVAGKANSSDLATVATSGSYNDLSNKPTIPTVNNATLTIQKNGTTVKTFTANASTDVTANITVPTKTSDLTNDSNFPVDANYVHTDNNFTTALKNKLDGIAAGAEVNQNAFSNVKVGGTTVAADSKTDTLELVAGSNVTLTPDATNDKVTIAATDTNTTYTFANGTNGFTVTPSGGSAQTVTVTPSIANATTSTAGLMSAVDKTAFENLKPVVRKLYSDGTDIPANADLNTATYLTVGRYKCTQSATAATLTNCPTNQGFMMDVYNTLGTSRNDQSSASWTSRTRKILNYYGDEWVQVFVKSGNSVEYGSWKKVAHDVDLPTVNNATLTIQKNGTNVQTFTANSSTNKTANITVPTKVTDLTDAANYVAKDGDFYATGEGSNFSMTGTSQNVYADLKVKGDTFQQTYTGKNLFKVQATPDVTPGVTYTKLSDTSFSIAATGQQWARAWIALPNNLAQNTSYAIKFNYSASPNVSFVRVTGRTSSSEVFSMDMVSGTAATVSTGANDVSVIAFYISTNNSYTGTVTISDFQIEAGSTATSFEPYVGGVPAPNPDYPQEVEVVTGRQVISSCGTNFYNYKDRNLSTGNAARTALAFTVDEDGWITYDSRRDSSTTTQRDYVYYTHNLPLKPSTQYSVIMEVKEVSGTTGFIDPYSRYIGYELGQFTTETSVQLNSMHAGDVYVWHPTTYANFPNDVGLRTYIRKPANATDLRLVFRLSVVADTTVTTSSFKYAPFTGKAVEINLGKNLFDKDNPNILEAYVDATTSTITSNNLNRLVWIPCEPNTTYTVQRVATPSWYRGVAWTETTPANGVQTYGYVQGNAGTLTITTGATAKYLVYRFYQSNSDSSTTLDAVLASVQIEKGSTATSYAPYFTPIELCKIGNYQDYIYPSGGKWYVHKETSKAILPKDIDGTNVAYIDNKGWAMNVTTGKPVGGDGDFGIGLTYSDKLKSGSRNQIYANIMDLIALPSTGTYYRDLFMNPEAATRQGWNVNQFMSWLTNNPIIVYYILATPTDTEITNPLLVAQLDDLWRNLQSGTNTTNVNVEGDLPAILGVTAFTNTLASAMAGINERMNRLPAIPQITMTTTDPGEGQTLADNHYIAVFE